MVLAALWWFGVATKVLGRDKGASVGGRVRVDRIGRDCELEISKILLMVDPEGGIALSARYGHSPLLVSVG